MLSGDRLKTVYFMQINNNGPHAGKQPVFPFPARKPALCSPAAELRTTIFPPAPVAESTKKRLPAAYRHPVIFPCTFPLRIKPGRPNLIRKSRSGSPTIGCICPPAFTFAPERARQPDNPPPLFLFVGFPLFLLSQ